MVEEGDDWQNVEIPLESESSSSSSSSSSEDEEPATIVTKATTAQPVAMPTEELHAEQLHQHG